MIAVVGSASARRDASRIAPTGVAAAIAGAAAQAGQVVQLIGKVREGPDGDAVLLSLARSDVGHVAVLRDPAPAGADEFEARPEAVDESADAIAEREGEHADNQGGEPGRPEQGLRLDAGDLELALRYLPDYDVVVIAQPLEPDAVAAVVEAARWAGAKLVSTFAADGLPDDATVFEAPDENAEGAFATVVGRYAAALDRGVDPAEAFEQAAAGLGWTPVGRD